jgi:hypothetical protein
MYKISTAGILVGIMTAVLILTATTATSVFAIPPMPSYQGNHQGGTNMMAQLFSGGNVKVGNMTLGFRPGVMVMPLLCMSVSGNLSGIPMLGSMMAHNMNPSGMMMGGTAQGNQSMTGLGAMMKHSGLIPSVCFSMSDVMLFRSMMMHGGSMNGIMGGNMTMGSSMMGGK